MTLETEPPRKWPFFHVVVILLIVLSGYLALTRGMDDPEKVIAGFIAMIVALASVITVFVRGDRPSVPKSWKVTIQPDESDEIEPDESDEVA